MQSFDPENFKTINTIIERDNKDTTYKFALLRGVILDLAGIPASGKRVRGSSLTPELSE